MVPRRVAIVPHTHWDREWYSPFQTFRMNLVDMLDGLIDLLESDPSYERFMLDGQMAVVDDYLEIRPEAEDRIRNLAASGRLTMGPWYILMDEFLVSGETIVRDLQMGIERGAAFGGVMNVGYLPDMFGHIAQMPQILSSAGFADTVLWRGVPSEVTKNGFFWRAPDGSTVRAEYLPVGYGNGAALPDDPTALIRRVSDHIEEIGSFLFEDLLLMNGSDHLHPQPRLGRVIAEANALQNELSFEITSLPEYLATAPREGLTTVSGELRSGWRANVLMGVTSNRIDVKRSVALAERHLERRAEPLAALFCEPADYPSSLLAVAWREMIRNSAHDSICACSVDDVVDAVLHRYAEARHIAEGVAARAIRTLSRSLSPSGQVLLNPSQRPRSGVVELVLTGDDIEDDALQTVSERAGLPGSMVLDATTVKTVLGMLQGPKIENDAWVQEVRVDDDDDGLHLIVKIGPEENPGVKIAEAKQDLYTRLGARPDAMVRVSLDQPRIRRVLARTHEVPGFGWQVFSPAPLVHPARIDESSSDVILTNGLVSISLDSENGTFSVDDLSGFGRLVDGGDLGDSYNYSPPNTDRLIDTPDDVAISIIERGPVRASAQVVTIYRIPDHVDGGSQSRVGEHQMVITTTISISADSDVVSVESVFVNPGKDHRLRVHLPLPEPSITSRAECAFATVERGVTAEGRSDEFGLPTFPSRRFVQTGGLTVVHEGLNEYELVDITDGQASALALTLLRSTGMLSRLGMSYRPFPAGPLTPVEGLQLVGKQITSRYWVSLHCDDPYAMADESLLPLEVLVSPGGGSRPDRGTALSVEGAEVTSVQRRAGLVEVRAFNPSDDAGVIRIAGRQGWTIDLRGQTVDRFDGALDLGPHQIVTIRLEDETP